METFPSEGSWSEPDGAHDDEIAAALAAVMLVLDEGIPDEARPSRPSGWRLAARLEALGIPVSARSRRRGWSG